MPKHQLVNIIDIIFLSILLLEISACIITDDEFAVKPGSIWEYFFESSLKKVNSTNKYKNNDFMDVKIYWVVTAGKVKCKR